MQSKKAVCICTATLALIGLILLIPVLRSELHDAMIHLGYFIFQLEAMVTAAISLLSIAALVVLSIIQIKKNTPKLMMITCGAVLFDSINNMLRGIPGAFLAAAALLPIITILSSKEVKEITNTAPRQQHYKLLIIAGILSTLVFATIIYNYIQRIHEAANWTYPTWYLILPLIGIAMTFGEILTCFIYKNKRSVLLRMLFFSYAFCNAILIPINMCIIITLSTNSTAENMLFLSTDFIRLAVIILVVIHTLKLHKAEKAQVVEVQDENLLTERS